jgi:hypothetical protein
MLLFVISEKHLAKVDDDDSVGLCWRSGFGVGMVTARKREARASDQTHLFANESAFLLEFDIFHSNLIADPLLA